MDWRLRLQVLALLCLMRNMKAAPPETSDIDFATVDGYESGGNQPALAMWFELQRPDGIPVWKNHQIDDNSGVGTQFEVADINRDGLLDVITSNKKGTFVLEQLRD